jgi:hypothetical protein
MATFNKILAALALIAVTTAAVVFIVRSESSPTSSPVVPTAALPQTVPAPTPPPIAESVAKAVDENSQIEPGFEPLFNGSDLTGWTGATTLYSVENGSLVYGAAAKGNLYTTQQYSNLDFRFEYRLTGGADNGVAIRTPMTGNPGYEGFEIQLLDESAERFRKVAPWQSNASVCGVAIAKQGYQKPVGEWNSEEIIVIDRHVTVILNGFTVVDADLLKDREPIVLDGKKHPGSLRTRGHIALMSDTPRVEFRNMRLKSLGDMRE